MPAITAAPAEKHSGADVCRLRGMFLLMGVGRERKDDSWISSQRRSIPSGLVAMMRLIALIRSEASAENLLHSEMEPLHVFPVPVR